MRALGADDDPGYASDIVPLLQDLDRILETTLAADASISATGRAFVMGGKRLRAQLLLAATCGCAATDGSDAIRAAAAIELIHAASLMHDDIVDHCASRRGLPALHRTVGARAASMTGWYLIQVALCVIADLPAVVRRRFAAVGTQLSRGQLTEIVRAHDPRLTPEERLRIMENKTAAVFGLACEVGGRLSTTASEHSAPLRAFGVAFGILFQIADDIDDLFATEADIGRPAGADLDGGVVSLPLAFALQSRKRESVARMLNDTSRRRHDVQRCRTLLRSCGALDRTREIALRYGDSARGHLNAIPICRSTAWMRSLVDATVDRLSERIEHAP